MNINPLLSQSLTFTPQALSQSLAYQQFDKLKQEEELVIMKKQIRQKEAQFEKDKAILIQQVELLKMQLNESAEREANLRNINENIMNAFQNNQSNTSITEVEINEDHPQVVEIIRQYKQEFNQLLQNEKERNREIEYRHERDNQQLHFKVLDLEKAIDILEKQYDFQSKEYQTLFRKYNEDLKTQELRLNQEHQMVVKKLEGEIDTLNADIERQVIVRLNQKYTNDQDYNQVIIKYQKEQQIYLDELKDFRKKLESLEKENSRLTDKLRKCEDENGVIQHKSKQQEKKAKEELEALKKQKEEVEKKLEVIESSINKKLGYAYTTNKKQMNTLGGVKSRNKNNSIYNKENIGVKSQPAELAEDEDEEKNKLRRQISLLRCQLKKLEIEIKDLKTKSNQEIAQLKDKLNVERKKRMNIYEDKIDKNNQLLQDLLEKDQTIISLNRQISKLTEKLQSLGVRSNTPNHLLAQSILQESMVHNGLTNSMVDLFPLGGIGNQNYSSKKLISPLRSLDLTMVNKEALNNLNSLSFSMLPLKRVKQKRQSSLKKNSAIVSPTQIRRARINSVHVQNRASANNLAASINLIRLRSSRDGSIAEVNEDLYKDSVESFHDNQKQDFNKIETNNIVLQLDQSTVPKIRDYYTQRNNITSNNYKQDEELKQALMATNVSKLKGIKQNEIIYQDSLDNESVSSNGEGQEEDEENEDLKDFYNSYQRKNMQAQIILQKEASESQSIKNKSLIKKQNISKDNISKHKAKVLQNPFAEDEDCLVNILDQEDTNIEVQPTITHTRQHLSTENLFRESQNTIDTLHSFRNQGIQKQIRDVNKMKHAIIPLPKPQKQTFQKGAVQRTIRLIENNNQKLAFDMRKNSLSKPNAHCGDNPQMMKSPSSPNIFNHLKPPKHSSSSKRLPGTRLDSCPSPLDEDETVMMLGSGEKLRIKEVTLQSLDPYQNQFKEQRHKFNATVNPSTTKNTNRQNSGKEVYGFRTRTNSLINSCCSEISFKMKFIRDMPEEQMPRQPQTNKHSRVPSMKISGGNNKVQKTFNYMKK